MGKVFGKIVRKQNDEGIPNLLVILLDASEVSSKHLHPKNLAECIRNLFLEPSDFKRLGTVPTNSFGEFSLEYDWSPGKDNKAPSLILLVSAPEESNVEPSTRLLYISLDIRFNASTNETYHVRLTDDALINAGIPLREEDTKTLSKSDKIMKRVAERKELKATFDKVAVDRIKYVKAHSKYFEEKIRPQLLKELSTVSQEEKKSLHYVSDSTKIHTTSKDTQIEEIKIRFKGDGNVNNALKLTSSVRLTDQQKEALSRFRRAEDGAFIDIPEKDYNDAIFGGEENVPDTTTVYRTNPIPQVCRDIVKGEKCLETLDDVVTGGTNPTEGAGGTEDDPTGDIPGENVEVSTSSEVKRYVARLMEPMTAPEENVAFGVPKPGSQLTADQLTDQAPKFSLKPGPADVPAFHDFHDLQIAFKPVWSEALDDRILHDAEAAYNRMVELTGEEPDPTLFWGYVTVATNLANQDPDANVISNISITKEQWSVLSTDLQNELREIAFLLETLRQSSQEIIDVLNDLKVDFQDRRIEDINFNVSKILTLLGKKPLETFQKQIEAAEKDAERIVSYADKIMRDRIINEELKISQPILNNLKARANQAQSNSLRYFAANNKERSVNFGIITTYRQKWTPITYQVGELVKTIPLAPREVRKFSKKTVLKKSRSRKEIENNLISRREESEHTSRAEAEIMQKANAKTNFNNTTTGTLNYGTGQTIGYGGTASTTNIFSNEADKTSSQVKKSYRQSVVKAAQEYKNERKVEITSEESFEEEFTESGEIQNPNDEITVTYLFYELQRRYRVSEQLHRLTSVVLVAQEMPTPSQIDTTWIIEHDWILNRVLLDDSFRPALQYISASLPGEELALKEQKQSMFRQRELVERLKEEIVSYRETTGQRYAALQRSIERSARVAESSDGGGLLGGLASKATEFLVGDDGDETKEAARIRETAARDAYEQALQEEREMKARLTQTVSALESATQDYTNRLSEHVNQLTQVERLRVHLRQNIIFYMQAIWLHEPDDQRYLRLRNVPVPIFDLPKKFSVFGEDPRMLAPPSMGFAHPDIVSVQPDFEAPPEPIETKPLYEVADLDSPLGFKGNYMIFPLRKKNAITDFMMQPYFTQVGKDFGIQDPDPYGNINLEEFSDYICCLKEKLKDTPDVFESMKGELNDVLKKLLTSPLRENEEIVVPTDSLFIEALVGSHPLIEDFKLMHRLVDVKNVQSNLRSIELDNIRRASRLLKGDYSDPDIDKNIMIEGVGGSNISVTDNPDA